MRGRRVLAWAVHLYTALGAPIALAAIVATIEGDAREAFLWMMLAVIIDSSDGALARLVRVKEVLPGFDGARLDDIVDYLNYVVVPTFFAWHTGLFPEGIASGVVILPLLASAYGFAQAEAKTEDFFFTGFPSYWNVVVFYFHALGTAPATNAALTIVFAILVFVPIRYVYPSRTPFLRPLTIGLGVAWGAAVLWVLVALPDPPVAVAWGSLAFPVYYLALSGWLHARGR